MERADQSGPGQRVGQASPGLPSPVLGRHGPSSGVDGTQVWRGVQAVKGIRTAVGAGVCRAGVRGTSRGSLGAPAPPLPGYLGVSRL